MTARAPGRDRPAQQHTETAAEKILDAAEQLFTEHDPSSVSMSEIAGAAGCSRATLYRYFASREALHTAYAHRWATTLYHHLTGRLEGIDEPCQRLTLGITEALALVRANPALASWFTKAGPPIGGELAERSDVVTAMVTAFLAGLDRRPDRDAGAVDRRVRWLVRILTSLLIFPGRDAADERTMIAEFVVPVVAPGVRSAVSPPGVKPGSRSQREREAGFTHRNVNGLGCSDATTRPAES